MFVRFVKDNKTIDVLSADFEDCFTLESFSDTIKSYRESQKLFIIAQVQTWDPKQPTRVFYSYYDAWQINKVLFQTQVYLQKKLLHRLHVLNPFTNTDIIGDVKYFKVVLEDALLDREITKLEDLDGKEFEEIQIEAPVSPSGGNKKKPGLKIVTKSPINEDQQWTLNSPRAKTLETSSSSRKKSIFQMTPRNVKPGVQAIQTYDKYREDVLNSPISREGPKSALPQSMLTRVPEKIAIDKFPKSAIPPGIITQFSEPIDKENIDESKFSQARDKSFCNSAIDPSSPAIWTKNMASASPKSPIKEEGKKTYVYYKATYFATDNDFLDKFEVRKEFQDNGYTEEHSKLFEMPPFTGANDTMQVVFEDKVCGIDIHRVLLVACVGLSILIVAMVIYTATR